MTSGDRPRADASPNETDAEQMTRPRRRALSIGAAIVLVVGAVFIYRQIARDRVDNPENSIPDHADAVVVFFGGRGRLLLATELMEQGAADTMIVNHGVQSDGSSQPFNPVCAEESLPYEVVCVTADPSTTEGEAKLFAELAAERGWTTLLAVTSDYHLERARFTLERCFDGTVYGAFDPSTFRAGRSERETWKLMYTWIFGRGC